MNEQINPSHQSGGQARAVAFNAPMAIVIAGALVAGAIYFSNKPASVAQDVGGTGGVVATPAPLTVGNFREVDPAKDHVRGASNPVVTIIEYSDLECPFCKRFHDTMKQVVAAYPDKVRWVYRHAPLVELHTKAPAEANAAECAGEQGKFWEFTDKVFEVSPTNNGLDAAQLPIIAQEVGVANAAQFKTCLDSNKYASVVSADLEDAKTAGMRGTPYSVAFNAKGVKVPINGALSLESVKSTVDNLLK